MVGRRAGLAALLVPATFAVLFPLAAPAAGHVRATTVYATATSDDGDVAVVLAMEYDLVVAATGLGERALAAQDPTEQARALEAGAEPIAAYVARRFTISRDGVRCTPGAPERTGTEDRNGLAYARLSLTYTCPGDGSGAYSVTSDLFSSTDAVVDDQTTILRYDLDGRRGTEVLDASRPSLTAGDQHLGGLVGDFLVLGFEHLALGADHLLFVLALLMGARSLRDVVAMASVFTAAHSVTLLLGALGLVGVPAWLVEPLIALSIAFVALANLVEPRLGHRLPVVFGFGLLHGLGFAGALSMDSSWSWSLLLSLLSFNLGIELGQLVVVALVLPLLVLLRRTPAHSLVLTTSTVAVAAVGLVWFAQRVPLISDSVPSALS